MKKLFLLAPLGAFVAIAIVFFMGLSKDPSYLPSMLIDQPVPVFELKSEILETAALSTETLMGEVTLLNVFGSWCASCVIEHPVLMEIAASGTVKIHGLNWRDEPRDAAAWLSRFGNPYTTIGHDQRGRVAIDFGVTGAPETFIIDQNGRIRHKHIGVITREHWNNVLLPLVEDLKNDPTLR